MPEGDTSLAAGRPRGGFFPPGGFLSVSKITNSVKGQAVVFLGKIAVNPYITTIFPKNLHRQACPLDGKPQSTAARIAIIKATTERETKIRPMIYTQTEKSDIGESGGGLPCHKGKFKFLEYESKYR